MKFGGEYRHFINENFAEGTGVFNFPSVAAFLAGTANAFNITLGERRSVIDQRAVGLFVQDQVAVHDRLTLELGMRYEWHVTPTERDNRFVVFDAPMPRCCASASTSTRSTEQNNRNFEPRVGVAWQVSSDGRTVLRAAYARAVDEPGTTAVRDTAGNPPFGVPLTATGAIPLVSALDAARPAGLAPATIDPGFRNASMQSWNVNVQRQLAGDLAATLGYLGSHGTNLRISRNINQPVDGVRPFAGRLRLQPHSARSPLGNITQVESSGFSNYHAAWVSVTKRLSRGLQFDTSYTWSKSLDTNSLNSSGFAVQDELRHRRTSTACRISTPGIGSSSARSYTLPFTGHALTRGWQVATVVQAQSGNPVNIVTSNSSLNGLPNTVRPDVIGPIRIIGSVDQWFDPSAFVAVNRFGNLGRNAVIGPGFHNTDLSVIKNCASGRAHRACSSAWTCSICSTIPTSARRATSSAARRSARSRGRACRRAKRDRRARFSWPSGCRSEMSQPMHPALVTPSSVGCLVAALWICPALSAQERPAQKCADHSFGRRIFSLQSRPGCGHSEALVSGATSHGRLFRGVPGGRPLRDGRGVGGARRVHSPEVSKPPHRPRDRDHQRLAAVRPRSPRELFPDAPIVFAGLAVPDESVRRAGLASRR